MVADMCISPYGVQPNYSYVPAKSLDTNGFVKVNEYFAVKGAERIFAMGDVSNAESPQFWFVEKLSTHVAKNMILTLSDKSQLPCKVATGGMSRFSPNNRIVC